MSRKSLSSSSVRFLASPLPLRVLFLPLLLAVVALHWTLLRLPYFWDEGGYYIPAAWDFFRLGTLIPVTTMRNAHPPLPSILLGGWWKLTGFHILSTRVFVCVVATCALLAVLRLARLLLREPAALTVTVLTAIYPVWFAQSTLAHADIFAAAFSLWAIAFYADRAPFRSAFCAVPKHSPLTPAARAGVVALLFTLACLAKETAILLPETLLLFEGWMTFRKREDGSFAMLAACAFPAAPLLGWYLYHRAKTGFMFGNPEFLRYNATANLSAVRVLLSLWHRFVHLAITMNLFVPVLAACAVLLFAAKRADGNPVLPRRTLQLFAMLIVAQWAAFAVLGGALLTRYLLPVYPLVVLLCVAAWVSRVRAWPWIAALSLAAFAIGCRVNPPYPIAPEDNLTYRDMIVVHQDAIRYLQAHYPGATVLSAWPVLADLQRPELGYLTTPMRTAAIQNFTAEEIAKAAQMPGSYDTALLFSTKYDPPAGGLNMAGSSRDADRSFYDYHRDLLPATVAAQLHGRLVWQEDRNGEWAAVLYFPRAYDVKLETPAGPIHKPLDEPPL